MDRTAKIERLSSLLYTHLIKDHVKEIESTGSLLPTKSLRHRVTRSRLSWASGLESGRWFTGSMVRDSLGHCMQTHAKGVQLPALPGFCLDSWLDSTAASLTHILQRAKKSTVSSAMDCAETLPYDFNLDPAEDRSAGFSYRSLFGYTVIEKFRIFRTPRPMKRLM